MRVKNHIAPQGQRQGGAHEQATTGATDDRQAARKLTFAENAVLTVKVLAGAGLVLAALWGLSLWTSAN